MRATSERNRAEHRGAVRGGTAEIEWTDFAAALINDPQVCRKLLGSWTSCSEKDHVVTDRELSLSGDNFAELGCISRARMRIGTGNPDLPHNDDHQP